MNQPKIVLVFLLLLFLSGCSSIQVIADNQPAPTEIYTQTSRVPADATLFSGTEEVENVYVPENAIDLTSSSLESATADGFLVIFKDRTYYFYDLKNKKIVDIGENQETINILDVSPNNKLMIYGICLNDKCDYTLRTIDKTVQENIPTETNWILARWLDNERVVFVQRIEPEDHLLTFMKIG